MIKITDKTKCSGCFACANICPENCIEMKKDNEGFLYPVVNTKACIKCGLCQKTCPIITPIKKENKQTFAFAAYTKDECTRKSSSSGGIFSEIAKVVLENDGVVFGAMFDDNLRVLHSCIDSIEHLEKLQGSKYVQSAIENAYKQAQIFLKEGKQVLFSGTPCQIEGLYAYLKKDYDNLITQDFICHGVPSPAVWQKYIDHQEKNNNSKIENAYFRNKDNGWARFNIKLIFNNGKEYTNGHSNDCYMQSFLKNLCLRPSCHDCSFKKQIRPSDITLADFWGINKINPEFDNDKGVSLLFLNSEKGKNIFDKISDKLVTDKVQDISRALKYNPAMVSSSNCHPNRKAFIKHIEKSDFDNTLQKYVKISLIKRVLRKMKLV